MTEVAEWATDWLEIQALQNRLVAQGSVESKAEPLRDLMVGTLQLFEHTACTAVGSNRSMHFAVGSEADYHKVGDTLAPKSLWEDLLPGRLGMRNLQIEQSTRTDGLFGKTIVTIAPSTKYKNHVFIDVNNEITSGDSPMESAGALQTIREHWPRLFAAARETAEGLLRKILA